MDDINFNIINNKIYLKNGKSNIIIRPNCFFKTEGIYSYKNNKAKTIKLILDNNKSEHKKFMVTIRDIYDKCSEYIELQDNFDPDIILNPLKKIDERFYNMYIYISDWNGTVLSKLYDINDNSVEVSELTNKNFSLYPAICLEKVTLNNDNKRAYVHLTLKEGYINNIEEKRLLDYHKMKEIIEKEK